MYIVFECPPLPHLIVGGNATFRVGDIHMRRVLDHTFDLIYVIQGELFLEENQQQFCLHAGDFIILPPHRLHRGTKYCQQETIFYWLHFYTTGTFSFAEQAVLDSNVIQRSSQQFEKKPFHICLPQYGTIQSAFQQQMKDAMESITQVRIDRKQHSKHFYDSATPQIKQQQLFFTILTFLCDAIIPFHKKDPADDIYQYLCTHYEDELHLQSIAQSFSFHPAYIIRLFKRKYQKTPMQVLMQIRLEKAAQLLVTTTDTIQSIALSAGFHDHAYFTKLFKRAYNKTPKTYREEYQQL